MAKRGWPAGKPRGPQSEEHRRRIGEGVPEYRQRPWLEASRQILDAANAGDPARASELLHEYLNERHAQQIDASASAGYRITTGAAMLNSASPPYVSDTTTRHAPMTGTHTHDHAAFGSSDHDDGIHSHAHTHHNDADHGHGHGGLDMRADYGPGENDRDGVYGRLLGMPGIAERERLRQIKNAQHDAQR